MSEPTDLQDVEISDDVEREFGPGERDVESLFVGDEPDGVVAGVGTDARNDQDVAFGSLEVKLHCNLPRY